jgi:chromosomal replication initiation ATPase DnaA
MTNLFEFLTEIVNSNSVPRWISLKAKLLLENKELRSLSQLTADKIMELTEEYYGQKNDWIWRKNRIRAIMDRKHILRYALFKNGVKKDDIASMVKCDRTTVIHSIYVVEQVSSVDDDFRNKVEDFLLFLEAKKLC